MNIEQKKKEFLDLLTSAYRAGKDIPVASMANQPNASQRVYITYSTLKLCGFDNEIFWDIICPNLKIDGYLKEFKNPSFIDKTDYYKQNYTYRENHKKLLQLRERIPSGIALAIDMGHYHPSERRQTDTDLLLKEIEETESILSIVQKEMDLSYPYEFVLSEDFTNTMIVNNGNITDSKQREGALYFDKDKNTLVNKKLKIESLEIYGRSLQLLKCFLANKTLTVKRKTVLLKMNGEDQHTGARKQLLSLLSGVADIESVHGNNKNKRIVTEYRLVATENE